MFFKSIIGFKKNIKLIFFKKINDFDKLMLKIILKNIIQQDSKPT